MSYARGTRVSPERTREEIETTLARYGADAFMYMRDGDQSVLAFRMKDRHIKFHVAMPKRSDEAFTHVVVNQSKAKKLRSESDAARLWDQACRERWRALALVIKAKLEAVASGISIFEDEFMAHVVMPDGKTVGEHIRPRIADAYKTGKIPPLLPKH